MQERCVAMSKALRSRKRWGLADPFPAGCDRPIWGEQGQSMGYLSAWPHYGGEPHSHIKMVGNSIRSRSIGPTSTHTFFDPFGGVLALNPYEETTDAAQNGQKWPRSFAEGGSPNVHDNFNSGSNAGGSTAIGVFCEALHKLWFDHHYNREKSEPVVACTGFGGTKIAWRTSEADPAHPWYFRQLDYFAKVKALCAAESKSCGVGLLTCFDGETDHTQSTADYYDTFVDWQERLKTWLQSEGLWLGKPAVFGHQAGDKWTSADPWLPVSNDQLRLSLDHHTVLIGPSYPYPDDPVGQHYVTNAVRNVALDCLVAANQIWIDGIDHQPTHWHEAYGKDDEIAFLYHTPDGSALDRGLPWKGCQQTSFVGMGYHSYGSDGIPNPVLDAWFPEPHVLIVKCQSPITGIGSGAFANYAAKAIFGGMGCLTTRAKFVWDDLKYRYHPEWGDDHHDKDGFGVHDLPIGREYDTRDWACAQAMALKAL